MTDHETPILGRWRAGNPRTAKRVRGNGQGFERIYYGCLIEVVLEIGPGEESHAGTYDEVRGHVILVKQEIACQPWHTWALFDHEWVSPGILRWLKIGLETPRKLRDVLDELEETVRPIARQWAQERDARRADR